VAESHVVTEKSGLGQPSDCGTTRKYTGDIGHLDGEGYLYITDRKKDMIISGGFNVYPSEIEQVIWSHQAVMDCAVIGTPHNDWGEAVTAVVELNPGMEVSAEELRKLCRDRLGSIRTPRESKWSSRSHVAPTAKY
jgi:acyl-CoA synthetase (AMP-forming)/AMP-acid ligase II